MKERRRQLESKRWQQVLRKMCEAVRKRSVKDCFLNGEIIEEVLKIAVVFGTKSVAQHKADWGEYDVLPDGDGSELYGQLWDMVTPVLAGRLAYNGPITQVPENMIKEAKKVAKVLNIGIDEMYARAVRDIPEPKAWVNLNANGTPKKTKPKKKAAKKKTATKK